MKRSLYNFFNFFKNHSCNLREFSKITRSVNSPLDILPPSKISWLWNSMTSHGILKSVASCNFVCTDLIQISRDRKSSIELDLHNLLSVSVDLQFLLRALACMTKQKAKTSKTRVYWDWTQTDCKSDTANLKSRPQILSVKQCWYKSDFINAECDEDWQDRVECNKPDGCNLIINPYRAHFYFEFQLICDLRSEL